jgi:uncharacterized membrane protein YgcG
MTFMLQKTAKIYVFIAFAFVSLGFYKAIGQQDIPSPPIPPEILNQLEQIELQNQSEHIQNYEATIVVNKDGSIKVTEKIRVFAKGDEIKRGIYRDFPTVTRTKWGKEIKPIEILTVLKDGKREPYFTEKISDGFRLYIGEQNVFLPTNTFYNYEITYVAKDQIRFFEDYDELYWNVTGNFWSFEVKNTKAFIVLPYNIGKEGVTTTSFYGPVGSTAKGEDPTVIVNPQTVQTEITFKHTQPLQPREGLTIVVGFPKNLVTAPTENVLKAKIYASLAQIFVSIGLFVTALVTMFLLWRRYGRDRGGLPSIPVNFEPPQGLSPLEVRYVDKMGKKDYMFLSLVLLGLAIKGYLKVVDKGSREYAVVQTKKPANDLVGIEHQIYNSIFNTTLPQNYNPDEIIAELTEKKGFVERLSSALSMENEPEGVFTFSKANRTKVLVLQAYVDSELSSLKSKFIVSNYGIISRLLLLDVVFIVLFFATQFSLFTLLVGGDLTYFSDFLVPDNINIIGYGFMALIPIMSIVFSAVMPRRTEKAREMQDKIEGFKIFLKSQEYYLKAVQNDIPSKFDMYEKYLPYAIALDLEPVWSEKFKDVIDHMSKMDPNQYNSWYVGRGGNFDFGNFSPSSFSSGIASSMVTTSSGSGSSGFSGGSSGGGGGGGGGGGW